MTKLVVILSLISNVAFADCSDTLNKCDGAYKAQIKLIVDMSDQINNYTKQSDLQQKIIDDQKKQLSSSLRDPIKVALGTTVVVLLIEIGLGAFKK